MKRLLKYLKSYKKECVLGPLFKMFEATLELIVPLVIAAIVDKGAKCVSLGPRILRCETAPDYALAVISCFLEL